MRIVLDPGLGGQGSPPSEAAANLLVASAAAAALRIAIGDDVEVALTSRAEAKSYADWRPTLEGADIVVRLERGDPSVSIGSNPTKEAKTLALRMAPMLRRELGCPCFVQRDGHRRLLRDLPQVVIASLSGADHMREAQAVAGALAAHVAASTLWIHTRTSLNVDFDRSDGM